MDSAPNSLLYSTSHRRVHSALCLQTVFESAEAEAAFLVNTLPSSTSNVKDNLMTKDNLTCEQCYQRLMDITTETDDGKAYATIMTAKHHRQRSALGAPSTTPRQQEASVERMQQAYGF